ncbi:MAG: 16S rRNA processing protein RimM [Ruminococcaceae bacterium]|nr:16S rRNA processing protein RimM [Oscillospiraceae bacterium]
MQEYLEAGRIINTHGIAGGVKIESWCDSPAVFTSLKTVYFKEGASFRPCKVLRASVLGKGIMAMLEGFASFDDANAARGRILYAARTDLPLPEGSHFIADLKGLPVIDRNSGRVYGKLKDVDQSGFHDLYVIDTGDATVLLPAVDEFVAEVDTQKGIFITPIEGFFSEAEAVHPDGKKADE